MKSRAILILSMMMLALSLPTISFEKTLSNEEFSREAVQQLYEYELYLDSPVSGQDGDGSVTTIEPDGTHEEVSILGGVEFRSAEMISDLNAHGRGSSSDKVRLSVFLKFTGQEGSTADITYTLQAGESTIATEDSSLDDPCTQNVFGGSCSWTPSEINFDVPTTGFTIPKGKQLRLKVDAQATCGQGGGIGGNNDCDVEMAFGDIESTDSFSRIELKANALADSSVKVHTPGEKWTNPETLEWAPNQRPENRQIQFSVDVRDAFGRDDIRSVRLILESPNGVSAIFDQEFEDDDLKLDNNGLVGNFTWTYDAGFDAGEYPLTLEIIDQQGHSVLYLHQGLTFVEHAIHLTLPASQPDILLIAPGRQSSVEFLLEHVGASSSNLEVRFELGRELPSSWSEPVWDSPEGYDLQGGADFARPILSIDVPDDDLSGAPSTIEVIARALAENDDGQMIEVDVEDIVINVEKVGIYDAPRISAFEDVEHQRQIADSNRPDAYDPDLAHYIDQSDLYGSFYIDVFNTGFDTDKFRMKVVEFPTAWQYEIYDNSTNALLEKSGLDYLTDNVGSHQQTSLRMDVHLPESRDEVDSGPITIEVSSIGGSENKSSISFRVHRTFGILVEVIGDSDSGNLGHVGPVSPGEKVNFQLRVTDSSKEDTGATNWHIVKPSALKINTDRDAAYGNWEVNIVDSNGTDINVLRLSKGEYETISYSLTTNELTQAGNHTIYMRVIDSDSSDEDADYFDLPVVIQVKEEVLEGNIDVRLVSERTSFLPNEKKSIEFKVENNNNVELPMIITVGLPSGWDGGMRTESSQDTTKFVNLKVGAFESESFTLDLTAPEDLTSNDLIEIDFEVVPMGVSQPYHEDYWQRPSFEFTTECSGMVCLINEVKNPRMSTAFLIGGVILIGLYAIYRKGASSGRTFEEELEEKYEHEEEIEEEIPEPVGEQLEIDEDVELLEELADL